MLAKRHIIQVVPRLPPIIDGIGDYAAVLGSRFQELGCKVSYLICDPHASPPDDSLGRHVILPSLRSPTTFLGCLADLMGKDSPSHLVIQFAPYAYQKRGVPFWLLRALQSVRSLGVASISTVYHELDASSSSLFESAFWISPVQRQLIAKLSKLSTFDYSNTQTHIERLHKLGSKTARLMTNFSTVGEPTTITSFNNRSPHLVVFGRPSQKAVTYSSGILNLSMACESIAATHILDVGVPADNTPIEIEGIPILRMGRLDSQHVSKVLTSSKAMYLSYPREMLGKSSVFAAARAHGTIPLVHDEHGSTHDPTFLDGADYFSIGGGASRPSIAPSQANMIAARYASSNSHAAAAQILQRIGLR